MSGPTDEKRDIPDNLHDLPDDVQESIADERDPTYGDETQRNEVIETEDGLSQTAFIEPEPEDDAPHDRPTL